MYLTLRLVFALLLLLLTSSGFTHEIKPAVTTLTLQDQHRYQLIIKTNLEALLLGLGTQHKETSDTPQADAYNRLRSLPAEAFKERAAAELEQRLQSVALLGDGQPLALGNATISVPDDTEPTRARTSTLLFEGRLDAATRSLEWHWPAQYGATVFRVRFADGRQGVSEWLKNGGATQPITLQGDDPISSGDVVEQYLVLGFTHIVPLGVDHILFVLGLFLLSMHWRPLLIQVTTFTLAHTITLGMTIYGLIALPASIVEPIIAASIVYVAVENLLSPTLKSSRIALVFVFGLIHGMGFAGVLSELGLPESEFLSALISFNIGVEFGQLAVILLAWLGLARWVPEKHYRRFVVIPGSLLIAGIGAYWTIERVFL